MPEDRIARFPADKRDESRLMVVERKTGNIFHHRFKDIPGLVADNDFLVVNNSKVIPVRLFGEINDKKVDVLIVKAFSDGEVEALALPARKFKPGQRVVFDRDLWAEVTGIGQRRQEVQQTREAHAARVCQ